MRFPCGTKCGFSANVNHTGAWLAVVPSGALGFKFGDLDYRTLLRFHLGLPLLPLDLVGAPCEDCGEPTDIFGDHAVTCKQAELWRRHNFLRGTLERIAKAAGLGVRTEVSIQGKERPADLLLLNWEDGVDAACDITVVHSFTASASRPKMENAVNSAEDAKTAKYAEQCTRTRVLFQPIGVDLFGACGERGQAFLGKLFQRYAAYNCTGSHFSTMAVLQRECWERFSVALHKSLAQQLGRLLPVMPDSEDGDGAPSGAPP